MIGAQSSHRPLCDGHGTGWIFFLLRSLDLVPG
jgi:hypothetical protein